MSDRLLATLIGLVLAASAVSAHGQAAPAISAETKAATGELSEAQRAEVDGFLRSCVQRMGAGHATAAEHRQAIAAVRNEIVAAYGNDHGAGYKRYFATSCAANFAPAALDGNDPLVQVNAALVVSRLRQPELAPVAERMIAHANPAVRYHGAKTYTGIRDALLSTSPEARERMMAGLTGLADREKSPIVLAAAYEALDLSAATAVPSVMGAVRPRARGAVMSSLRRNLPAVRAGDARMSEAVARGARVAAAMSADMPRPERTELLQTLAELMKNAGATYVDLFGGVAAARDRQKDAIEMTILAYSQMLGELERVTGQITGFAETPVATALAVKPVDPARVLLAVNEWVGTPGEGGQAGKLAGDGVKPPTVLPGAAGPTPATAPANET